MCIATIPALAVAAAGTYMKYKAQSDADDRQQQALRAAGEQSDRYNAQSRKVLSDNLTQYDPTTRAAEFQNQRDQAGQSLSDFLTKANQSGVGVTQATQGHVSNDYLTSRAKTGANELSSSIELAKLMGRLRASGQMQQDEGLKNADAASQQDVIASNRNNFIRAAQPGIESAGIPNANLSILGSLLQAYGTYGAAGANGKVGIT